MIQQESDADEQEIDPKVREYLRGEINSGQTECVTVAETLMGIADNGHEQAETDYLVICAEQIRDAAQAFANRFGRDRLRARELPSVTVTDPDTHLPVDVALFKTETGWIFGLDESWFNEDQPFYSPIDFGVLMLLEGEEKTT